MDGYVAEAGPMEAGTTHYDWRRVEGAWLIAPSESSRALYKRAPCLNTSTPYRELVDVRPDVEPV